MVGRMHNVMVKATRDQLPQLLKAKIIIPVPMHKVNDPKFKVTVNDRPQGYKKG